MSLSDLATIGSIVSSLAVAVSLVYLGLQTHQATKHTRALISQGRSSRQTDFISAFSDADRVAALLEVSTGAPPTPQLVKQVQTQMYFQACFGSWADIFEQHREGLLGDDPLADMRASISLVLRPPTAQQYWNQWKSMRPDTHAAFKAWVDNAIATPPIPSAL